VSFVVAVYSTGNRPHRIPCGTDLKMIRPLGICRIPREPIIAPAPE